MFRSAFERSCALTFAFVLVACAVQNAGAADIQKLFSAVERKHTREAMGKNARGHFQYLADGGAYRHELMLSCLDPVLAAHPHAKWVTLGDVWGQEAIYIHKKGGHSTATSLQDVAIREAKSLGFVDDFAVQNAEAMTYGDGAFDFTFIKEAFHHLARPYAGVYEMVRVAKRAAILFEPADIMLDPPRGVNASIFHATFSTEFEPCGFQYRLNSFEMVKTAMGLNLPAIAFRGWNDPYKMPLEDNVREEYEEYLWRLNDMGAKGERVYNLLAVVFLKTRDAVLEDALTKANYTILKLQQFDDTSKCT